LRRKLGLPSSQVALFGSWEMFHLIGEHEPGSIVINAGYRDYDGPHASARMHELSALQFEVLTPWTEERHDYITFEMALEYLRTAKPRGGTLADWHGHGNDVQEAEQIWTAIVGPDTPARDEVENSAEVFQRDIAPTILDLMGIDYRGYDGVLGNPIELAVSRKAGH